MKTYKKEIEKPLLEIKYDKNPESPRKGDNLGYFITFNSSYHSPDKNEKLERIIKKTGEVAENQEKHIEMIKEEMKEEVIAIYPITKYEHGGIFSCWLGNNYGWDYNNNGFYIITEGTQAKKENFEKQIKQELEIYNSWMNGLVYQFILYDKNGEIVDNCGDFYDIEDIRKYLPKEWKNEDLNEYLIKL